MKTTVCYSILLLILITAAPAVAQPAEKPNIIFIFADDLGWGDLSSYGGNRMDTPNLDSLAAQGTLFTQFYVPGSVCSPSRAGIMSGLNPSRNRVFGHFMPVHKINAQRGMPDALNPDLLTVTDVMKQQGYTTGHFGKWHLGNVPPSEYGIDAFSTNEFSNLPDGSKIRGWEPQNRPHTTEDVLAASLDFIKANQDQPFYVNAWLFDVHATLNPSEEQLSVVEQFKPKNVDFNGIEQVYLATLKEVDQQIGLFLEELDKLGLRENTLIIFSSDNGPEDLHLAESAHSGAGSPGPFRGRKRSLYEGGIRVPFILRWPGRVPEAINTTSVVSGLDFISTLAHLTGVQGADTLARDGENMADVWLGAKRKRNDALFWDWRYDILGHVLNHSPMIAVRDGDYKLLVNPDGSRMELYNLTKDPSEVDNLATEQPKLAKKMAARALEWYATIPESPVDESAGTNRWPMPGE